MATSHHQIRKVWSHNLEEELMLFSSALETNDVIAIDTEFPGAIFTTPKYATEGWRYMDFWMNINLTKILQLGITVSTFHGSTYTTWEFNFHYDLNKEHAFNPMSIDFLKEKGLSFENLAAQGIGMSDFALNFKNIIFRFPHLKWVTFHGLYDMGYLTKILLLGNPFPPTMEEFSMVASQLFRQVVDIKCTAQLHPDLGGGGLEKLAKTLQVERIGDAHHAGFDSLLIFRVFHKIMISRYGPILYSQSCGRLHGLNIVISPTINMSNYSP